MNFVQNSYNLVVEYQDNPNSTISTGFWYNHWPSYLTSSVRPVCEPANLAVNTQFFTNQTGLLWTITSVYKAGDDTQVLPTLPYINNPFEACTITEIQMDLDGSNDLPLLISRSAPWSIDVYAFVTCSVMGPTGPTLFNATALYSPISTYTVAGSTNLVSRNTTSRASMYWAEVLMERAWLWTVDKMAEVNYAFQQVGIPMIKGYVLLYPNATATQITDPAFFDIYFGFRKQVEGTGTIGGGLNPINYFIDLGKNSLAQPQIWEPVDMLAKSVWSGVLADLGQIGNLTLNAVANATTLESFSNRIPLTGVMTQEGNDSYPLVPGQLDYKLRQNSSDATGPLGLTPSVISTKYLCQVPQRKPLGDIFISVLLADLVLLQAAWRLYVYVVDAVLVRRDPSANHCEACVAREEGGLMSDGEENEHGKERRVGWVSKFKFFRPRSRTSENIDV